MDTGTTVHEYIHSCTVAGTYEYALVHQDPQGLQRIVFTKTTSAPSDKRSAIDFVNFVHSLSF